MCNVRRGSLVVNWEVRQDLTRLKASRVLQIRSGRPLSTVKHRR
jgi:hypothetical protein